MLRALLHRCLVICVLAAGLLGAAGPLAAAEGYLAGIPDLPLMPGLQEVPDSGLIFDKPEGRIVEAYAAGAATPQAVTAFYDETLPHLGWRREKPGAYLREGERLSLELARSAAGVTVLFRLSPQ